MFKWEYSAPHKEVIAYIPYGNGALARIEYNLKDRVWDVELLNKLYSKQMDFSISSIEKVKLNVEILLEDFLTNILEDLK